MAEMQPHKRRKTLLACNQCRDRKTRCSGDRPLCRSCQERRLQCQYEHGLIRASSSSSNTEYRLRLLEQPGSRPDRWAGLPSTGQPRLHDIRHDFSHQVPSTQAEAIHLFPKDDSTKEVVRGDSSTNSFLSQVNSLTHGPEQEVQPDITWSPQCEGIHRSSQFCDPPATTGFVPEPDVDVRLMESFWQNVHPIFPLLHRPSVLQAYESLCEPHIAGFRMSHQETNTFLAILNIVFALGVQYDKQGSSEQRITRADTFYQKSLTLVSSNVIDKPTQSHVQLFLLTAVYLHSTAHANRCWDMVGAGLRVAIGLGLFRESGCFHGKESQLKREMRRRTWFCCVSLDTLSAATFGRPTTLRRSWQVVHPKAIDDELLQRVGEGSQPPGLPSYIEGFVYSLGIFGILGDALAMTNDLQKDKHAGEERHRGNGPANRLVETLSLNSRLEDLIASMPDHLKWSESGAHSLVQSRDEFRIQAQVLHCRIHYVRLLILRPWLLKGVYPISPTSLTASTLREIRSLCIATAQQTIDIIHDAELSHPKNSSWHTVYFLHAAASVLIAAALLPEVGGGIDLFYHPYQCSWHKALQTLKNNEVQMQASLHSAVLLESCWEKLRCAVVDGVREEPPVQGAGSEEMLSTATGIDWAIDLEPLDFLQPDFTSI